jgi:hypothetical protein
MTLRQRLRAYLKSLRALDRRLRDYDGVHHVDVGYRYVGGRETDDLAARIFVHGPKRTRSKSRKLAAKAIDGLPVDVIVTSIARHCASTPEARRTRQAATLVGGVSIGPDDRVTAGTLGAVVRSRRFPDTLLGLTADHVVGMHGRIYQPGRVDSAGPAPIGYVVDVSPTNCAALVRLDARANLDVVIDLPSITGFATPAQLEALVVRRAHVRKSGRSTGVTTGRVNGLNSLNGAVAIGFVPESTEPELACEGDSGAIWMTADGTAVALHYGGAPALAKAQAMHSIVREFDLVFE